MPQTTLKQIVGEGTNAETIYKLRNKIIHNEVPYDNFLAKELASKIITTPLQAIQEIINIATAIYEKLVIEVGK